MSATLTRNLIWREPAAVTAPGSGATSGAGDVYFIGYPSHLFKTYAPLIAHALGDRLAGVVSDAYVGHFSGMTVWGKAIPLASSEDLHTAASRGRDVELVHFYESLDQYQSISGFEAGGGVRVVDFLAKLDQLKLLHTYVPVNEERHWWAQRTDAAIGEVRDLFGDELSRRTLDARVSAILRGDRRSLLEIAIPAEYEYYNRSSARASLLPGDEATYVDVGAAHGDTVERFVGVTGGAFERIFAFEPTPGQYAQLARLAESDRRISTFRNAVGDAPGKMTFYDHPRNPFAGNALTADVAAVPIEVECVRLDDVVDRCTLIKLDVEGFETRVLGGARRLVSDCRPDMAITCYHYPQDLFEIVALVRDMHAYRHIALRHYGPTLHDTVLLFSDRQSFA
jgi:FkbM family methyltransferase